MDMSDEADSTGVVLVSRVVQSLLSRHRIPRSIRSIADIKKGPLPIWERPFARYVCNLL